MKKLLIAVTAMISFSAYAQENTLLNQNFWKEGPTLTKLKAEVEKGNNPTQFNFMSMDPTTIAILNGAPTEVIKYLLAQPGNDVTKITHDGRTYLHWAANKGNLEIVTYLISKGAVANFQDAHGATPLNFAAGNGQPETKIYDILIAHGADLKKDLNQHGANALLLAVGNDKDLKVTNYFVSKGLDINSKDKEGNNAFSYAAKAGNIEIMKALLAKGIKPDANAMILASQGTRRGATSLEAYQYLETLNLKPVVAGQKENVLHSIVRKQNQNEIIKYFLTKGVDVNQADEYGNTVLINAAGANKDIEAIALLLPNVKDINAANLKGETALALALRNNSAAIVSLLISKGADVNTVDKSGNNLAYYLLESYRPAKGGAPQGRGAGNGPKPEDFEAKISLLKAKGFDIAKEQKDGNNLFHLAVAKNDITLLKRINDLKVNVNGKNAEGLTALHKAAMIAKDDNTMKYLLSIGAEKNIATDLKETAFDLASENESLEKNNISVTFLK